MSWRTCLMLPSLTKALSLSLSQNSFSLESHKNLRNLSLRELFLPLVSHEKHLNSLCFSCVSPLSLLRHIHSTQITETNRTNYIDLNNSNRTVEGRYLSVASCKNSNWTFPMNLQLFPSDFSYTVESTGGLSDLHFMLSVSVCTQHLLLLLLLLPQQQQTH
jgi:hypothetical protein